MAATNALTTASRIKTRLDISTTSYDEFFDSLIGSVSTRIEQLMGRTLKETDHSNELYDGSDEYGDRKSLIVLKNAPVSSFTSLEYKIGTNESPSWIEYSENDYDINENAGIIYCNFPRGKQNVRASYTAGYSIDFSNEFSTTQHTLPADLSEVCERVVVRIFKKRNAEGISNETFEESSVTWNQDTFTKEDITTLNNYNRVI